MYHTNIYGGIKEIAPNHMLIFYQDATNDIKKNDGRVDYMVTYYIETGMHKFSKLCSVKYALFLLVTSICRPQICGESVDI